MDSQPTEYDLALRARDGDQEALAELVERTRVRLFSLAYAELRHYDDAQDAVAAALLQICLHVSELRQPERIRAWMQSIVRNEASRIRRGSGISPVSLEEGHERTGSAEPALLRLDIERALQHLPEDEAEAIRLFYLAEFSTRDIARKMERPEGTVSSWLHRGRRHLAARMEAYAPVAVPNIERAQSAVGTREKGGDKMAWQRFTERARAYYMFGHQEVIRRGGREVGSEHVLYGLVAGGNLDNLFERGISGMLLVRLGVSLEHVRREIERQGKWDTGSTEQKASLTQDGKRVIDLAYEAAKETEPDPDRWYVGTEHLLLGVLREENGIGGRILRGLGVEPEGVLRELPKLGEKLAPINEATDRLKQAKDDFFSWLASP